jgi:hypothetical protein
LTMSATPARYSPMNFSFDISLHVVDYF